MVWYSRRVDSLNRALLGGATLGVTMSEDIMRKVKALLALAQSPNEHEASAAAEKAQELMLAYNLDMAQTPTRHARGEKRFGGGLYKWQRTLWDGIAKLNFCMYWCEKGTAKGAKWEHKLLGAEHNVASAKVLADYLEQAINRFVVNTYGSAPADYFSASANSYRQGMADKLAARLADKRWAAKMEEARRAAEAKHPSGTANALVVTISDLEEEEMWANLDALHGREPGYNKAISLEHRAAWQRRAAAEKEADEALKAADPLGYQERKAKEKAASDEFSRKYWEKQGKKDARKKVKEKPASYWEGLYDGDRIALDEQLSDQRRKALGSGDKQKG